MHADRHCNTVQSSSKSCSNNNINNNKGVFGELYRKTVYSIATKTCPLAVYRRFSQAKSEGANMGTFEKWGHSPPPSGSAATALQSLKVCAPSTTHQPSPSTTHLNPQSY